MIQSRTSQQAISRKISTPTVWLGQSADTSSICSGHPELSSIPFLTSLGCAIRRPSLTRTHFNSSLRKKLGLFGPLMIDSGGFALMMNPDSKWTIQNVSRFVERIDADIFVSLDHPPAHRDSILERERKIKLSVRNFRILTERFPKKIVMPVVHGRTTSEIDLSIELIGRQHAKPSWIGFGGIVPLLKNRKASREISQLGPEVFIAKSIAKIRSAFPGSTLHVFGAGGTRTFPAVFAFGADSADSIGWRQAAGFGSIFLPLKSQRAISWNEKKRPPRKLLDEFDLAQLELCKCPICAPENSAASKVTVLRESFYNRSIHNAWTVSNQFRYWPSGRHLMLKLISTGGLGPKWAKAADIAS